MAAPVISSSRLLPTVHYRTAWSGGAGWVAAPRVEVDSCTFALQPTLGRAQLTRHVGVIHEDDGSEAVVLPLDLRGALLRVTITRESDSAAVYWYGYCPNDEEDRWANAGVVLQGDTDPTVVRSGICRYTAYELAGYLDELTLTRSRVGTDAFAAWVDDVLPFNQSPAVGGQILGNRADAMSSGADYYAFAQQLTERSRWTAQQVVDYLVYLLREWTGQSWWDTAGQYEALADIEDVWEFSAGTTLRAALNAVINPRYGFTWQLGDGTSTWPPVIVIRSFLAAELVSSPVTIPANQDRLSLALATTDAAASVKATTIEGSHYDRVVARGGPLRCCWTMQYDAANGLAPGWTDAQETAYQALDFTAPIANSLVESLANVYRDLLVPATWTGYTADALTNLLPVLAVDSVPPVDVATQQPVLLRHWALDPVIPFSIVDPTTGLPRWLPPLGVGQGSDGLWRLLHVEYPGTEYKPIALSVLRDRLGVRLHPPFGHYAGVNHYTGESADFPVYDWQQLRVTVMAASNQRVQVELVVTDVGGTAGVFPDERRKVIELPTAELWYIAPGTVTGVDAAGALILQPPGTDDASKAALTPRNDLDTLRRVAAAAAAWYREARVQLAVTYQAALLLRAGDLAADDTSGWSDADKARHLLGMTIQAYAGSGDTAEAANSIVSSVTYAFGTSRDAVQTASFSTDWQDLDFRGLARRLSTATPLRGHAPSTALNRLAGESAPEPVRAAVVPIDRYEFQCFTRKHEGTWQYFIRGGHVWAGGVGVGAAESIDDSGWQAFADSSTSTLLVLHYFPDSGGPGWLLEFLLTSGSAKTWEHPELGTSRKFPVALVTWSGGVPTLTQLRLGGIVDAHKGADVGYDEHPAGAVALYTADDLIKVNFNDLQLQVDKGFVQGFTYAPGDLVPTDGYALIYTTAHGYAFIPIPYPDPPGAKFHLIRDTDGKYMLVGDSSESDEEKYYAASGEFTKPKGDHKFLTDSGDPTPDYADGKVAKHVVVDATAHKIQLEGDVANTSLAFRFMQYVAGVFADDSGVLLSAPAGGAPTDPNFPVGAWIKGGALPLDGNVLQLKYLGEWLGAGLYVWIDDADSHVRELRVATAGSVTVNDTAVLLKNDITSPASGDVGKVYRIKAGTPAPGYEKLRYDELVANSGQPGAIRDGTGVPSSGTGNDGDWYIRTDSPCGWYKKVSGSWVAKLVATQVNNVTQVNYATDGTTLQVAKTAEDVFNPGTQGSPDTPPSTCATPTFGTTPGDVADGSTTTITCSAPSGTTIYYTLDGSTPTHASSSISSGSTVTLHPPVTVKAIAAKTGWVDSAMASAAYTLATSYFTWSVYARACGDGGYGTSATAGFPEASGNITESLGTLPIDAITKASSNGWQAYVFMQGDCGHTGTLHVEVDYTIGAGGEGFVQLYDDGDVHDASTAGYVSDAASTLTLSGLSMVSGSSHLYLHIFVRHGGAGGTPTVQITAIRYTWS